MIKNKGKRNQGQVMLVVVILFMSISLIVVSGIISPTIRNIKVSSDLLKSKQSLFLSGSGVADAIYRIKNNLQISEQEFLSINEQIATTSIIDTFDIKNIISVSNYSNYFRSIEVKMVRGIPLPFYYGAQTGKGGFTMSGNSQVNGSIYSGGSVSGGSVIGSVVSAGPTGFISDVKVGALGVGDAHAHTVLNSNIQGLLKCKVGFDNNKICDTSFANPGPVEMPISSEQIAKWKTEVEALPENIIVGNYSPSQPVTLGPVKITGNFEIKNTVNMVGTIWVEGELKFLNANAKIILDTSTYENKSGVILVDKYVNFSGGSQILSTGIPGSYVMLLITSDCPVSSFCSDNNAISASGGAGSVVLAAPYGTISFSGNSKAKQVIADKIIAAGTTLIEYEDGLAEIVFLSGPSGDYSVVSFSEVE